MLVSILSDIKFLESPKLLNNIGLCKESLTLKSLSEHDTNEHFKNGLLPNKYQNSQITIIINKESGEVFKLKKMELTPCIAGYFNSVSQYDISQYKSHFGIDLNEEKSFNIKYTQFGSSTCITDSNYVFSIGGVNKNELTNYHLNKTGRILEKSTNLTDDLNINNILFTPDSLYFLRSNNDPRILTGVFFDDNKLIVCGGIRVFTTKSESHKIINS